TVEPPPKSPASWGCRPTPLTSTFHASWPGSGSSAPTTWRSWLMDSTPCPQDHELLALVAGGAVPDSLRRHVGACGACRVRVERLRAEVAAVRRVADELPAAAGGGSTTDAPRAETAGWPPGTEPAAESESPTSPGPMERPPRPESIGRYR